MKKLLGYLIHQLKRTGNALLSPSVTVQYPFVTRQIPLFSRQGFRLDTRECTGCLNCESKCPTNAINIRTRELDHRKIASVSSNGLIFEREMVQLTVDYGRCVFCGICVEECDPQALSFQRTCPPVGSSLEELKRPLITTRRIPKKDNWLEI